MCLSEVWQDRTLQFCLPLGSGRKQTMSTLKTHSLCTSELTFIQNYLTPNSPSPSCQYPSDHQQSTPEQTFAWQDQILSTISENTLTIWPHLMLPHERSTAQSLVQSYIGLHQNNLASYQNVTLNLF